MLAALKFVQGAVAKKDFVPSLTHFRIENGTIKGYNGMIALCCPIDINLAVSPRAIPFIKSIQACQETIAMHITAAGRLSIKSGKFKAFVDCTDEPFPDVEPEGHKVKLNGKFLEAIKVLAPFIAEDASRPWSRGILFYGQSAYATNNVALVEHWLGYDFPTPINVPKQAVNELLRIDEEPEYLQIHPSSVSFHFADRRWLKTQTFDLGWPNVVAILSRESTPVVISAELFESVETLVPFVGEIPKIYFMPDGTITTDAVDGQGAVVEVAQFGAVGVYNIHQFLLLHNVAKTIDMTQYPAPCMFFGDNIRGALVGMRE